MDLQATQTGQNFATNVKVNSPGEPGAEAKLNQTIADTQRASEQNKVELQTEGAQGKQESADNLLREGQRQVLDNAVEEVQSFLQVQNRNLAFSVDESSRRPVVTVKDSSSGDVIRQIPSEEGLRVAERIKELQQDIGSKVGVLFNKQV